MADYEILGKTQKISATSRVAIKIRDNFYTTEASEERVILSPDDADMKREWSALFNSVNDVVDDQMNEIIETFKK